MWTIVYNRYILILMLMNRLIIHQTMVWALTEILSLFSLCIYNLCIDYATWLLVTGMVNFL
jgi:hypothetical protein